MTYLVIVLLFLVALVVVGSRLAGPVTTQDQFMVAGRTLTAPVLIGTLLATWIGSGSIIGAAGLAFEKGFAAFYFDAGVWIALIVLYFVAGRARLFAQYTVPDMLEVRYNALARLLGSLVTIVAYTAIVSYQFKAGGMVLQVLTGLDQTWGMAITAIFVIGYTALAGMISVAYTDLMNGICMFIGLAAALLFVWSKAGGWNEIQAVLPPEHLDLLGSVTPLEAIGYALPTMLLLLGESCMYQRFFSAKDARTARIATVGWIVGTIAIESIIILLAMAGRALFPDVASEMIILHTVKETLPVVVGGLAIAAIVAVIVSTADSFLLAPSTSFMRDIYQRFIDPHVAPRQMIRYSRLTVIALGIIAFVQVQFFQTVLEMALYAYTMYGVGITPVVMAAFFWKRATAQGAVASIVAGMISTIVVQTYSTLLLGPDSTIPTVLPALACSVLALVVGSLLTAPPAPEKVKPFFQAGS